MLSSISLYFFVLRDRSNSQENDNAPEQTTTTTETSEDGTVTTTVEEADRQNETVRQEIRDESGEINVTTVNQNAEANPAFAPSQGVVPVFGVRRPFS